MTVDEALEFFKDNHEEKIVTKLRPLQDVGLGYLQLGQSSSTLSGGEAQRVKLASFLVKGVTTDKTLFIFDPSTGLHFHDIQKLLKSLQALIDLGHSVIVIEHQPDIIKSADYIIDIGPEAGKHGGEVVLQEHRKIWQKIKNLIQRNTLRKSWRTKIEQRVIFTLCFFGNIKKFKILSSIKK
jgi:excinuclease ABC subunit A